MFLLHPVTPWCSEWTPLFFKLILMIKICSECIKDVQLQQSSVTLPWWRDGGIQADVCWPRRRLFTSVPRPFGYVFQNDGPNSHWILNVLKWQQREVRGNGIRAPFFSPSTFRFLQRNVCLSNLIVLGIPEHRSQYCEFLSSSTQCIPGE